MKDAISNLAAVALMSHAFSSDHNLFLAPVIFYDGSSQVTISNYKLYVNPRDANSKDRTPTHSVGNKFPRGQLGLPIIFKFKNQDEKNGDPQTQTLQGKDFERLSSPLILRPIACSDGAVGIGLALETPREPLGGVILKGHHGTVQTKLDVADIANIRPMYNASKTEIDVVKAFLKTI